MHPSRRLSNTFASGERSPQRAKGAVAAALAGAALLAAGCGSSSPSSRGAANLAHAVHAAYSYSACMRNHGVSRFPDPTVSGNRVSIAVNPSETNTPAFDSAQRACRRILPAASNGPAREDQAHKQALLAFARCLRSHGEPSFPDPDSQGQLSLQMVRAANVDLQAPQFMDAARACVGVTHGAITLAQVAQAVNQATSTTAGGGSG